MTTTALARYALSVSDRIDTVLSTAEKNRKVFESFSYPDVKELVEFNKSCNEGLSDKIGKLLKGKPAEQVKQAKEVLEITTRYGRRMQKLTGDFALLMANRYLAPALEDMQKVCKTVIDKGSLSEKDAKTLKEAKERWSNNKDEAVVEAKKQEAKETTACKDNLKELSDDLKILKVSSYGKLLTLLGKIEALPEPQRVLAGRQALPHVRQMVDEVEKFAVSGAAGSLLAPETEQLLVAVRQMAKELSVVLLPPAMDMITSAGNTALRKGA